MSDFPVNIFSLEQNLIKRMWTKAERISPHQDQEQWARKEINYVLIKSFEFNPLVWKLKSSFVINCIWTIANPHRRRTFFVHSKASGHKMCGSPFSRRKTFISMVLSVYFRLRKEFRSFSIIWLQQVGHCMNEIAIIEFESFRENIALEDAALKLSHSNLVA